MKKILMLVTLVLLGQYAFAIDYSNPNDPVYKPTESTNRCNEFVGDTAAECQDYNRQAAAAGCVGLTDEALAILANKNLIAGCIFKDFKLQFTFTCKCGCFHPSTDILTSAGQTSVDKIVAAPDMYDVHGFTAEGQYSNLYNEVYDVTRGDNLEPLVAISAGGRDVKVTASHPVLVLANGDSEITVVKAKDLDPALHQLVLAGGDAVVIDSLDKNVPYYGRVYNFSTGTEESDMADHIVSANGLLMGDLYLQNTLGKEAAAIQARQ
ncbi:Hint domain-containing protein [Gynuella sp.]|uniref:Hint domain-containing protein n=1 Tax=Gynuella sp. TaxID=2969146 RepID=UPI003D1331ED